MTRYLVTGGAGFIGSNFVHLLNQRDPYADVIVLDKLTYAGNPKNLDGTDCELIEGSIDNAELVNNLVEQSDVVLNFAAESHNDNSLRDPGAFIQTNVAGTFQLLEAVRKFKVRLHHISTDEVFGDLPLNGETRFTEETPYNPSSPYSATKASSDHLVRAWIRSFGIDATITNCSNNFGPRQHVEKFIPRAITNLLEGKPIKIYGSGAQIRDWIHVDDHNSAVFAVLQRGRIGETYNIGARNDKYTNLSVAEMLCEILGGDIEFVSDRAGHDQRYAIDPSKITTELGWIPQYGNSRSAMMDALRDTVAWYEQHREWWEDTKPSIESAYAEEGH